MSWGVGCADFCWLSPLSHCLSIYTVGWSYATDDVEMTLANTGDDDDDDEVVDGYSRWAHGDKKKSEESL